MLFPALLAIALAGCVSAEELRQADEARCAGYGFQLGTPDFAACLQREDLARRYTPPGFWAAPPPWPPWPYRR
ncbi:MAG TPA: hypothetical protein VLV50_12850 [Stellaceae bacterium]|nr:hypothetical protein [Stellaceae bacterium]